MSSPPKNIPGTEPVTFESKLSTPSFVFHPLARSFLCSKEMCLNEWHGKAIARIMLKLLQSLSNSRSYLQRREEGEEIGYCEILQFTSGFHWLVFMLWYLNYTEKMSVSKKELCSGMKNKSHFFSIIEMCLEIFTRLSRDVEHQLILVEDVQILQKVPEKLMMLTMKKLGHPLFEDQLKKTFEQLQIDHKAIQDLKRICDHFFAEQEIQKSVGLLLKQWKKMRISDISSVVHLGVKFGEVQIPTDYILSLPWFLRVIESKLFNHFWDIWRSSAFDSLVRKKVVRDIWERLFISMVTQTISLPRLNGLLNILKDPEELRILFVTTTSPCIATPEMLEESQTKKKEETRDWPCFVREAEIGPLKEMEILVKHFDFIQGIYHHLSAMKSSLEYYQVWLEDPQSVEPIQKILLRFEDEFSKVPWKERTPSDIPLLWEICSPIPACLVPQSAALFKTVIESKSLFEWLKKQRDDQDFQRGIEMAMGRSEMECPVELWVEGDGKSGGRPNEKILSMLQSIRTEFHKFIYRKGELFPNLNEFISQFLESFVFTPSTLPHLRTCKDYSKPLGELLGSSSEQSAPERLCLLYDPSCDALWICETWGGLVSDEHQQISPSHKKKEEEGRKKVEEKESTVAKGKKSGVKVALEYKVTKKNGMKKQLMGEEIEDFQSTVVLSRTDTLPEHINQTVTNFIESYGWLKVYASVLSLLKKAAYFDLPSVHLRFPLNGLASDLRDRVLNLQTTLRLWEELVYAVRTKYFWINFFNLKMIHRITLFLLSEPTENRDPPLMEDILYGISSDDAFIPQKVEELKEDLRSSWRTILAEESENEVAESEKSVTELASSQKPEEKLGKFNVEGKGSFSLDLLLRSVGRLLDAVLVKFSLRSRTVPSFEKSNLGQKAKKASSLTGQKKMGGFRVVLSPTENHVYRDVMCFFFQEGIFPERRTLFLCRSSTDWIDLELFLMRWLFFGKVFDQRAEFKVLAAKGQTGKPEFEHVPDVPPLFCISNVDYLPVEVQVFNFFEEQILASLSLIHFCLDSNVQFFE